MGEVVQLFEDAAEPNTAQALQNCYDETSGYLADLPVRHNIDYDVAVIAVLAAIIDEAEMAASKHEAAQDVLDWLVERCSRGTE